VTLSFSASARGTQTRIMATMSLGKIRRCYRGLNSR
jgi:hypothetical protein